VNDPDDAYLAREAKARKKIDQQLASAGWIVQSHKEANVAAGPGLGRHAPTRSIGVGSG